MTRNKDSIQDSPTVSMTSVICDLQANAGGHAPTGPVAFLERCSGTYISEVLGGDKDLRGCADTSHVMPGDTGLNGE